MTNRNALGPEFARSWLLVNGTHTNRFRIAEKSRADSNVLDIEDGVAPTRKAEALGNVVEWLSTGHEAWVRINGFGTEFWERDCRELAGCAGLQGVMLAMVESPEAILRTSELLPGTRIVALVETARGVQQLQAIAEARPTFRLGFGLGDYRRDTGFDDDPMILAYTRSQFTIASRGAGLPGPIDGPAVGALGVALADAAGVTAQFGMTGKICLNPEQAPIVNEILSPSQADISWANSFLREFEAEGGEIRDGSDIPRLARARKILHLAELYGIEAAEGYTVWNDPTEVHHS
ncbi:CoA ester lyase [Tessaracoccus sp. OS52]|uniref:HpcH/HpaI aldolase/citrate lyase family protein n=1 Tax=Tessaracoccus sp. OS52 TaxID=2886691 RepID=UPI001D100D4B|nr:CoA ester lyase [Tessaracoccus sp. OS52]